MEIFTPGYLQAKERVLNQPTLENWKSFEAERNALPNLFPNRDFHNPEALRVAGKRANDFATVTYQVVPHLRYEDVIQSTTLMLAYNDINCQ